MASNFFLPVASSGRVYTSTTDEDNFSLHNEPPSQEFFEASALSSILYPSSTFRRLGRPRRERNVESSTSVVIGLIDRR